MSFTFLLLHISNIFFSCPPPPLICTFTSPPTPSISLPLSSTVAIYLGIKKRQSPGPPDAAGIWRCGARGTRPRWFWLCGRRRRAAVARSTRPGPSSSPAPTEPPAPALPLKRRCASYPTAPPRPAVFDLSACGGHHLPFGTLPPKCPKNLNSEGKRGWRAGTKAWDRKIGWVDIALPTPPPPLSLQRLAHLH